MKFNFLSLLLLGCVVGGSVGSAEANNCNGCPILGRIFFGVGLGGIRGTLGASSQATFPASPILGSNSRTDLYTTMAGRLDIGFDGDICPLSKCSPITLGAEIGGAFLSWRSGYEEYSFDPSFTVPAGNAGVKTLVSTATSGPLPIGTPYNVLKPSTSGGAALFYGVDNVLGTPVPTAGSALILNPTSGTAAEGIAIPVTTNIVAVPAGYLSFGLQPISATNPTLIPQPILPVTTAGPFQQGTPIVGAAPAGGQEVGNVVITSALPTGATSEFVGPVMNALNLPAMTGFFNAGSISTVHVRGKGYWDIAARLGVRLGGKVHLLVKLGYAGHGMHVYAGNTLISTKKVPCLLTGLALDFYVMPTLAIGLLAQIHKGTLKANGVVPGFGPIVIKQKLHAFEGMVTFKYAMPVF